MPLSYHNEGLDAEVLHHFGMKGAPLPDLTRWQQISDILRKPDGEVRIGLVGKYTVLPDAYKSVMEALNHGGLANNVKVNIELIDSTPLDDENADLEVLDGLNGIILPGGFGKRGAAGKMRAARFARERDIPCFGICYGMQLSVIEAARTLAGISGAGTTEYDEPSDPLVGFIEEWTRDNVRETRSKDGDLGGTMRLGAYPATLKPGSKVAEAYGTETIEERHRHRYEVNIKYKEALEEAGMVFSGLSPDGVLPEIVKLKDHPWFVGVQFHPELKSRPFEPHPLFASFIGAAVTQSRLV